MPHSTRSVVAGIAAAACLTACGGSSPPKPPGPDVRGLVLTDAEAILTKAHVGFSEHAKDALLGIVIKERYIVCSEVRINAHLVRLEVAKHGC